ncbi:methyltransferase [Haloplasma contractile]|uniref:Phospholipid methyltransferase protein n=1 Tax=Haloplasma contractile SSD-17B TaxID=1033810 RepID=U2FGJ6_9MOLU|nr:methyltransferase [Haloplasma contractile]ERJ11990.1 Phospholipid methyltransferase protein [Haloplasma contractile SSD-17B]
MIYVLIGIFSFVLMFLFDVFTLYDRPYLKRFFGIIGLSLFIYSTIQVIVHSDRINLPLEVQLVAGILCLLSLLLLVFSLFIEVSFIKTYGNETHNNNLVNTGTYALCRHPGVLWFAFIFLFLFLFTGAELLIIAGISWTLMDVIYILLQERYIFNHMFKSYPEYQKTTPMLIPNRTSINKCIETIIFINK